MYWNGIIMDTTDKLLECLNKVTWKGVTATGYIDWFYFQKGIEISDYYMEKHVNPQIIREEGLEKWSIVITPYPNYVTTQP